MRSAISSPRPLVAFFGWPAAILVPFVPAVHALRLFGRMKSDTDRSWMVFFAGAALLLPVVLGLMTDSHFDGTRSSAAGIWGGFIAHWWRGWFGSFGAWVIAALAWSVLMAASLAWNPIRALIGAARPKAVVMPSSLRRAETTKKRRKKAPDGDAVEGGDLALALEPPPEEMPVDRR